MSSEPVCLDDLEKVAVRSLPKNALDYYRSGANQEQTLQDNLDAFKRYRLRPRMLVDVSTIDLSTSVLGHRVSLPIGVAPTAMQRMAHPEGECATARAADSAGTVFTLSTIATSSVEEVDAACPASLRWFQLYIFRDRTVTKQLVKRAENSGFSALVLTVDAPVFGQRLADVRNKFSLPTHLRLANFDPGDDKSSGVQSSSGGSGINEYVNKMFDDSITWKDVAWLKSISSLPLILKGILTPEDAIKAVEHGAASIIVSNHGARQIDGVLATIEALSAVVGAVGNRCEVYMDGGVRQGTDVLKALALGAKMVFVGRPALWGLAYGGEDGVKLMLEMLRTELTIAMKLAGCPSVADVGPDLVVHESNVARL